MTIEKLSSLKKGDIEPISISIVDDKLYFAHDTPETYISAGGEKKLELFVLRSSGSPDGDSKPTLCIGKNSFNNSDPGEWTVVCSVEMSNAKPVKFTTTINWNGGWCDRINEMQLLTKIL